jgi:hypothetical protein
VAITSIAGDTLGGGRGGVFTLSNSDIRIGVAGATLRLTLRGDDFWDGVIRTSASGNLVVEGLYTNLRQNVEGTDARVGLDLRREFDQRCNEIEGLLSVDRVRYAEGALVEVDLRLAQRCTGDTGMLQAQVRWVAGERPVRAAAPAVPETLWRPAAGSVPASGNVVVIESTGNEPVFEGRQRIFSEADAVIGVSAAGDRIEMSVRGSDTWFAQLRGIDRPGGLQPGFYDGLRGFNRGYNPARGALEWYRGIAMCMAPRGWFALDRLRYERGALVGIEFRFEQRCPEQNGVVRGLVRWDASARQLPPAPRAAPAGTWAPPSGSVPSSGNHLFLASTPGDTVGAGLTWLYTDAGARFVVFDDAGALRADITDSASGTQWRAVFRSRGVARRLEAGYRGPLGEGWNPAIGGLQVTGDGRGCTVGSGWFMVDEVSHRHGVLRHVALRFEMRCTGSNAPLNGSLRWTSDDPTVLSGPADPPWPEPTIPPAPVMPAAGSAALFESRGLDFIGQGLDWLYTPRESLLYARLVNEGPDYQFGAQGDQNWTGRLRPPAGQSRLQPGRYDIVGPGQGGAAYAFDVSAMGRSCSSPSGTFEILEAVYSGNALSRLELRFEQYCDGLPYPLLGHFRWRADDSAAQPAQPQPLPADLWAPPQGALSLGVSAVYLQSNPGGFVGAGKTELVVPGPGDARVNQIGSGLQIDFARSLGVGSVAVNIDLPPGEPLLRPGYYPATTRDPLHPLKLRVELRVDSRGCNEAEGWLAVDDVVYDASGLQRIALRLQQVCDGSGPPAMAALQWTRPSER